MSKKFTLKIGPSPNPMYIGPDDDDDDDDSDDDDDESEEDDGWDGPGRGRSIRVAA